MILRFLEESLQHNMIHGDHSCLQIDPRWSLDAPWVLLDSPKNKTGNKTHSEKYKWKPVNLEICKDAHREIIEIGLVKNLPTSMGCHLVTNRMPDFGPKNS